MNITTTLAVLATELASVILERDEAQRQNAQLAARVAELETAATRRPARARGATKNRAAK